MSEINDRKMIDPNTIYDWSKKVSEKINESDFVPQALVGLNRGGIIPLGYLSYGLNTRDTFVFDISLYEGEEKQILNPESIKEEIRKNLKASDFNKDCFEKILIVDDLIDSGETMEVMLECFKEVFPEKEVKIAVLYQNTLVDLKADFYGYKEEKKEWLVFPWDMI